jgi:hypothetical protein
LSQVWNDFSGNSYLPNSFSGDWNAVNGEFLSPDTGVALRTVGTVIEYGQSTGYHYDALTTFRFAIFALI